jgi:hypothetical protein
MANEGQPLNIAINTLPIFSRIVIPFDLRYDGQNCLRTVIQRGEKLRAYAYKQNDAAVPELCGARATSRDTPLLKASETSGGARFKIHGISITTDGEPYDYPENDTTYGLTHYMWPGMSELPCNQTGGPLVPSVEDKRSLMSSFSQAFLMAHKVQLEIDGDSRGLQLGIPAFWPGQGGVKDSVATTHGDTFASNFVPIPEGITWNPSGTVDSNLILEFEAVHSIVMPTWTTPAGTVNGLPYDAETNPKISDAIETAIGRYWRLGFMCNFHGVREQPTSGVS